MTRGVMAFFAEEEEFLLVCDRGGGRRGEKCRIGWRDGLSDCQQRRSVPNFEVCMDARDNMMTESVLPET